MGERLINLGKDLTTAALTGDISKLVDCLFSVALSVKRCKGKCLSLANKVRFVQSSLFNVEEQRRRDPNRFPEAEYHGHLSSFIQVVQDSISLVERYKNSTIVVKIFLPLKLEADFDALDERLETCRRLFQLHSQVTLAIASYDIKDDVRDIKDDMKEIKIRMSQDFEQIQNLSNGSHIDPADSLLQDITLQEPLYGGYMIEGMLEGERRVILIDSNQERREAAIMKLLSADYSAYILHFFGRYSKEGILYAVMERPANEIETLHEAISSSAVLRDDWRLKRMIAYEIALGVSYAHLAGVLHRNLRSSNVFLTDDYHPKIFGFLQGRIKTEPSDKRFNSTEQVRWAAPEMLRKDRPQYNEKCDVFSLGVILWELITNQSPFADTPSNMKVIAQRTRSQKTLEFPGFFNSGSEQLQKFMQISLDCMHAQPDQRPGMMNIVERLTMLAPEQMHIIGHGDSQQT